MRVLTPLLLILFCLVSNLIYADTFVVTSNADSGPGTLRDALTQAAANGTTVIDSIDFNLPGTTQAALTITLQSQLPDVTPNIIIDGTTQPGIPFGVSNAKVILLPSASASNINGGLNVVGGDATAIVGIYGLFIKGFTANSSYNSGYAIYYDSGCKLLLGAPGKGNVICANALAVGGYVSNFIAQSNFISLDPDGQTEDANVTGISVGGSGNDLILIGGDDPADGNLIADPSGRSITVNGGNNIIKNNYFGTNYNGTSALGITNLGSFIVVSGNSALISDNVFSAGMYADINANSGAQITVRGNYFGTDKTQAHFFGYGGTAINEDSGTNGIIGGLADSDQNIFTHYDGPISANNYSYTYVIKNSFYCNSGVGLTDDFGDNYIWTTKLMANEVSGDAPPGAMVQLYYTTEQCGTCNPNTWFATVTANANGKWDYVGNITGRVLASSTINGSTTGFYPSYINTKEITVINYDCHHMGSIKFTDARSGYFQFVWTDSKGNIVGNTQEIDNLMPGSYTVTMTEAGGCPSASRGFYVSDLSTHVSGGNVNLQCGDTTTFFSPAITTATGIIATNYYWLNSKGDTVSTARSPELPVGNYSFFVMDSNGCASNTVSIDILPQSALPTIDDSKAVITDADCGQNDGSITGIITANVNTTNNQSYYAWYTSDGVLFSFGLNLNNAPPGNYYFGIVYNWSCSPLTSRTFTIGTKNNITIDTTNVTVTPSGCIGFGSVTGLQVSGSTQYQWRDANNNLVGTNINLNGVPPGTYTFTATNSTGCIATSKPYTVKAVPPIVLPTYPYISDNTCPNSATGSVTLTVDSLVAAFQWYNSQGNSIGIGNSITGQPAGTYTVYLTDKNGCRSLYNTYTIHNIIPVTIQKGPEEITGDQCNLKQGSITSIAVGGGIQPYTYQWTDSNGNTVAQTANLDSVGAGTYTLTVIDASGCTPATAAYTIQNTDSNIPTPSVSNVQLCSSGSAMIGVNNASATGIYNLYTSESSTTPAEQSTGGKFRVNVTANTNFFITQVSGSCESSKAEVDVTVGLSALNIANTFTPNGDGINDYWKINNIENYPQALVQIFTRYGEKIFESRGYAIPFDGTYKGQQLPAGVYYFIINLNSNCSLLSGSLTIIR